MGATATARVLAAAAAAVAAIVAGLSHAPAPVDAGEHTASRSLDTEVAAPGGEVTVTISAHDFGPFGRVSETLPEGWEYTGSSLPEAAVSIQDRTVRFLLIDQLLDEGAFTYTVRAPQALGTYAFSGFIEDSDRAAETVGGVRELLVFPGGGEEGEACLRGPVIADGFSLAVTTAAISDLDACASGLGVAALYALHDGEFVSWAPDAPESANLPFLDLFADGIPPLVPLLLRGGMPPPGEADAADARLVSLALDGVEFGAFSPGRTEYAGVAADGAAQATVSARSSQRTALLLFESQDADGDGANGRQLPLEAGRPVTVSVASPDRSRTRVYRVWIADPATSAGEPAAGCMRGDIARGFSLVVYAGGTLEHLEECAGSLGVVALYALVDGAYVPYIVDAPDVVNSAFRQLYPHGLPPATPLVVGSGGS